MLLHGTPLLSLPTQHISVCPQTMIGASKTNYFVLSLSMVSAAEFLTSSRKTSGKKNAAGTSSHKGKLLGLPSGIARLFHGRKMVGWRRNSNRSTQKKIKGEWIKKQVCFFYCPICPINESMHDPPYRTAMPGLF